MSTITLPEYTEWYRHDNAMWIEHITTHYDSPNEACPACAVRLFLTAIYTAVFEGPERHKAAEIAWSLQDGYGATGMTPPQGFDWSGIRDSSPAAVKRIHDALKHEELIR